MQFLPNAQIDRLLELKDFFISEITQTKPSANSLTQKTECGHALNAETVYSKNITSIRFLQSLMQSRSNEKSIEVGSSKGAGSGFDAWQVHLANLFAGVRIETNHASSMAEGDP